MEEHALFGKDIATLGDEYFNISEAAQGGWCILRMKVTKLDMQLAPRLKSLFVLLSGNGIHRVAFDMTSCNYCDSSGLGAIVAGHKLCRVEGGKLVLYGLNPNVERLLKISQLDSLLPLAYTEEQLAKLFA